MFALVDCNSCFASCEAIFNPALRDKPVIVLSNNDGCIVARNAAAKALGVPAFEYFFRLDERLKRQGLVVFSSNFELYADISARVMATLRDFAPRMEVYSIDEAFLDLSGMPVDLAEYGREIRQTLWQHIRMPTCVGIAPSKTLAKLANHIAKKSRRLEGVCVIEEPARWEAVFRKIPVSQVWGIGKRLTQRLGYRDIATVHDLIRQPPRGMRKEFGVVVERIIRELNGEACIGLEDQPDPKKQIFSTRSFGQRVTELPVLEQAISSFVAKAAEKLRRQGSLVQEAMLFIETSRHGSQPLHRTGLIRLPYPTNDTGTIASEATRVLAGIFVPGREYARAGVGFLDIVDRCPEQLDFYTPSQTESSRQRMEVMDGINQAYGSGTVFLAGVGTQKTWQSRRDLRSPAYTTRWGDIPCVRVG